MISNVMLNEGNQMSQTWPSEKRMRRQRSAAILATTVAALDGMAMVLAFNPTMVLMEIALASCAVLQWCQYFNVKSQIDIGSWLAEQHEEKRDTA
jgi:hypothetical protein